MKITKKFRGILGLTLSAMLALGSVTTSATTRKIICKMERNY